MSSIPFKLLLMVFPLATISFVCAQFGELPTKSKGKLNGILVAKGNAWIEVKDDEGYPHRYLPGWVGGPPNRGGGFDRAVLSQLDDIPVGNRVQLTWHWDGHLRVDRLKLLRPYNRKGVTVGKILDKGDHWVEMSSSRFGIPFRYYARWVGGLPERGGGYDEGTLSSIEELQPDDKVKLTWVFDARPRIVSFRGVEEEESLFVPFYEKVDLFRPQPRAPISSSPANPFDQVTPKTPSTVNPFGRDAGSPFDHVSPNASPVPSVVSPFDMTPSPSIGVAPNASNPFEKQPISPPVATPSPFDSNIPANPFDVQSKPIPTNPFDK